MDMGFHFLDIFEHREQTNQWCSSMIVLSLVTIMVTYNVWWMSLFTFLVGCIGYFSTTLPMTSNRILACSFFQFASLFILFIQILGIILLLIMTCSLIKHRNHHGWEISCILLGSMSTFGLIWSTIGAYKSSRLFYKEIIATEEMTVPRNNLEERLISSSATAGQSTTPIHPDLKAPTCVM